MSEKLQVMRDIATWILPHRWNVYYNQRNADGYPTFTADTNSRPDMMITKKNYSILIEVKPCSEHQDLLNGYDQLLKYAGEYYSGRVTYKTNITRNINAFALATKYSRNGYLYSNEANTGFVDYVGYLAQHLNMTEKPITFLFTRMLWRQWEKGYAFEHYSKLRQGESREINRLPKKPYVGVLTAKILSNRQIESTPYLYLNSNKFIPLNLDELYLFEES
ncbi:MAG: hypothetical protein ABIJ47_03930 [Candidatus Bathyarchaeota archaeon]